MLFTISLQGLHCLLIVLRSIWLLKVLCTDDKDGIGEYAAMFFSFSLLSLTLTVLVLICIINAFKFYIVRTKILDPPMPWGTDETFGLACTRVMVGLIAIGYPATLYAMGLFPRFYYLLSKQDVVLENPNLILCLYFGPYAVLIILFLLTNLGSRICKSMAKEEIDGIVPKQIRYFSWVAVCAMFLVLCTGLLEHVGVSSFLRWKIVQVMTSFFQIIFPASIVLNNEQLKSYSINFFKKRQDDAFLLNIYIVPSSLCILMYGILYVVYKIIGI